ncbi:MAG: hypothetical protein MN733_35465 [Nitrososphaera sp.]|nr:hypothetical protein [Nitrososphaera sp.]
MTRKRRREEKKSSSFSSKKIIAYAAIGILALAAVSAAMFSRSQPATDPAEESRKQAITQFQSRFCGQEGQASSTQYVSEIKLPSDCEMPLAIQVDDGRVWYVSTKHGTLGSYDIANANFEEEHIVPSWPVRSGPTTFSMSWSARADNSGNIWFTDERQKAIWRFNKSSETFDVFYVPANLPASIDFDSGGNIYFIGIQSQSIFFGDVTAMSNGTSEGIKEIGLPLEGFTGIQGGITTGSLVVDDENNDVWVSLLAFQQKGQLLRYDVDSDEVNRIVDLPDDLSSPVGLTLDGSGRVWVTDHGTNIFFRYDPASEQITKFVTSIASSRIYGGTTPPIAYTLPYWIQKSPDDNSLWFNEHTGNKMARFDPDSLVLTEYWIPSQNSDWAVCPPDAETCGTANALQFSAGRDGQVWFSEWTENKMGSVDTGKAAPLTISAQDRVSVARGSSVEIPVTIDASVDFDGQMMAAGTFTPTAQLGDSTGIFSEESVEISGGDSKQVSYTFSPAEGLGSGEYTIMIGAGDDEVSVLKAVTVAVV